MPTTLPRTTITHTPLVQRALGLAAGAWPEDANSSRALLLNLINEGARTVRDRELEAQYTEAMTEWEGSEDARLWDLTVGDGLDDEE